MGKGVQLEVPTPGQNQKYFLAAVLDPRTGQMRYVLGPRKDNALFRCPVWRPSDWSGAINDLAAHRLASSTQHYTAKPSSLPCLDGLE
jgi:hypothetical protein